MSEASVALLKISASSFKVILLDLIHDNASVYTHYRPRISIVFGLQLRSIVTILLKA